MSWFEWWWTMTAIIREKRLCEGQTRTGKSFSSETILLASAGTSPKWHSKQNHPSRCSASWCGPVGSIQFPLHGLGEPLMDSPKVVNWNLCDPLKQAVYRRYRWGGWQKLVYKRLQSWVQTFLRYHKTKGWRSVRPPWSRERKTTWEVSKPRQKTLLEILREAISELGIFSDTNNLWSSLLGVMVAWW